MAQAGRANAATSAAARSQAGGPIAPEVRVSTTACRTIVACLTDNQQTPILQPLTPNPDIQPTCNTMATCMAAYAASLILKGAAKCGPAKQRERAQVSAHMNILLSMPIAAKPPEHPLNMSSQCCLSEAI